MSKKMNTSEVAITTTTSLSLKDYFEKYPNASLRKLAQATNINYGVLLKKSKEPIPGEAYDPEAINWPSLEAKLTSKEVDWGTLDWEALNAGPSRKGTSLQKDIEAFKVGDEVFLRRDNTTPYKILYKTDTHVVIMKVGSTEPQAWANNTFLINGPVFEPRATKVKAEQPAESSEVDETEAAQ
nr:MAG TPA: hypothetical protein [Caudoviricetes sp.]